MFNISVDAPDGHTDAIKEDLSINEMESIVEIVLEQCFDIANAIPEHDEEDDNEANSIGKYSLQFFCNSLQNSIEKSHHIIVSKKIYSRDEYLLCDNHLEKDTPPPKC
jgi:hypothetical protein